VMSTALATPGKLLVVKCQHIVDKKTCHDIVDKIVL